jgi:putative sterol carrier protein
MVIYFPTPEWLKEYEKRLNQDKELEEMGKGWGVDWNGDFIFQLNNLPLDKTRVGDLPKELLEGMPEDMLESMKDETLDRVSRGMKVMMDPDGITAETIESMPELADLVSSLPERYSEDMTSLLKIPEELPEYLMHLVEVVNEYITEDGTVYSFVGLKDGKCTGAELISSPEDREHGFVLEGDYADWKALISGELAIVKAVMSGTFKLHGDLSKVMRHIRAAVRMAQIASDIHSESLF